MSEVAIVGIVVALIGTSMGFWAGFRIGYDRGMFDERERELRSRDESPGGKP